MIYEMYTVGGELYHARDHKYIDKVRTKSGKWRYIYPTGSQSNSARYRQAIKENDRENNERRRRAITAREENRANMIRDFGDTEYVNRMVNQKDYGFDASDVVKSVMDYELLTRLERQSRQKELKDAKDMVTKILNKLSRGFKNKDFR